MALLKAKTESGMVEGLYSGNPEITVFKGIPYAAPPVGQLRSLRTSPPKRRSVIPSILRNSTSAANL